jgi:hypothetical protein
MHRTVTVLAATAGLAAALGLAAVIPAAATPARRTAPQCNTMRLVRPDGASIWLRACGSGPTRESPFADWLGQSPARRTVVMDGVTALTPSNCPRSQPCVLIGNDTPPS